jgi:hypothetical protein
MLLNTAPYVKRWNPRFKRFSPFLAARWNILVPPLTIADGQQQGEHGRHHRDPGDENLNMK